MPQLTKTALQENLPPWGLLVLESHHAPEFEMEWRTHAFHKIIYVLSGAGELQTGQERNGFSQRDLLVVPAGVRNRVVDHADSPCSLYLLCLSRDLLGFDRGLEKRIAPGVRPRSSFLADQSEAIFRRLIFSQRHEGDNASLAMAADSLALLNLVIGAKASDKTDREDNSIRHEIVEYLEHLNTHFYEPSDIDTVAARLGISRRAFTQRFRALTGESWLGYVKGKAIDHACSLLSQTSAPITSIAFECGFNDVSSFYRQFKSRTGSSPAAWRKAARGE